MGKWGARGSCFINFASQFGDIHQLRGDSDPTQHLWVESSSSDLSGFLTFSLKKDNLIWPDFHQSTERLGYADSAPGTSESSDIPCAKGRHGFSMSAHPISCSQNKSWFLLAPCPEPYMRYKRKWSEICIPQKWCLLPCATPVLRHSWSPISGRKIPERERDLP